MLEQQPDLVRYCHEQALRARQHADAVADPRRRAECLEREQRWLQLAASEGLAERIDRFLVRHAAPAEADRVIPLLRASGFEPPIVALMCRTFDALCQKLGLQGRDPLYHAVAKAVIAQARRGIKDADTLERSVLIALGLNTFLPEWKPAAAPAVGWRPAAALVQDAHLARLPLRPATFAEGQVLLEPGRAPARVYVPTGAVVAIVASRADGEQIQTAMLGPDALIGAMEALDARVAAHHAVVQVGGPGMVCDAAAFRAAALPDAGLLLRIARHERAVLEQAEVLTLCTACHSIENRLARWLLHAQRLSRQPRASP